jgi:hypothetical protein
LSLQLRRAKELVTAVGSARSPCQNVHGRLPLHLHLKRQRVAWWGLGPEIYGRLRRLGDRSLALAHPYPCILYCTGPRGMIGTGVDRAPDFGPGLRPYGCCASRLWGGFSTAVACTVLGFHGGLARVPLEPAPWSMGSPSLPLYQLFLLPLCILQ